MFPKLNTKQDGKTNSKERRTIPVPVKLRTKNILQQCSMPQCLTFQQLPPDSAREHPSSGARERCPTPGSLARQLEPEYRQLEGEQTARNEPLPSSNVVNSTSESHLVSKSSISASLRPSASARSSTSASGSVSDPSGKRARTPRM